MLNVSSKRAVVGEVLCSLFM